jgi:hypothetical protein
MQSQYSSTLTTSSQAYCQYDTCPGSNYYFEAIYINVATTGYYIIVSNSTMNTVGYIYNDSFNPIFPSLNLLAADSYDGGNSQFRFLMTLQAMTNYILVVTTSGQNATGSFTIIGTGLTSMSFSHANISSKSLKPFHYMFLIKQKHILSFREN